MSFFAGLLTFVLVVNCLMLILLILVQLPKKDAGAGLAFGGGTADCPLFGAGSGNAPTKITKWATVVFLVLALFLGYLQDKSHGQSNAADFARKVQEKEMQAPAIAPAPATQPAAQTAPPAANTTPAATIPAAISGAATSTTNSAK